MKKKLPIVLFFIPIIIYFIFFPKVTTIVVEKIKAQLSTTKQHVIKVVRVEINEVNVREKPTTTSNIVRTAVHKQQFKLLKKEKEWIKIQLPNNEIGYIITSAVSIHKLTMAYDINKKRGPLLSKVIILDPGHGGNDGGTTGFRGTKEKELTLKTANRIKTELQSLGATVILTRTNDTYVDLSDRIIFAHEFKGDAFISLHYDSNEHKNADGITTFFYDDKKDKQLGISIHQKLIAATNLKDRNVTFGNLQVLRHNERPAILLELGFLSNAQEETTVTETNYQTKVSKAIADGLLDYFHQN
ncbi:MAG: N-acetylmuramoyl-L-alanine amidase [Bacillaceae bacterium]